MSSLDPEQVGVLGNAGGVLMQADEAGQSAVTVVLRGLQDLERLVKEASSQDVRDGSVLITTLVITTMQSVLLTASVQRCCAIGYIVTW